MSQSAQSKCERWIGWIADLGLAYIGGIAVGAPVGLLFRAATGLDAALTTTMIVTMAAVLVCCRRRRGHPLPRGARTAVTDPRGPLVSGIEGNEHSDADGGKWVTPRPMIAPPH